MSNGAPRRVVLVTGLSGAGRSSILHVLEDLGYEAIDNPPLPLMEELVTRGDRPVAVGVDTRSRGFAPDAVLHTLARLRLNPALHPELVFAAADTSALLRRYTETRRRHPLAQGGRAIDGILADPRAARRDRAPFRARRQPAWNDRLAAVVRLFPRSTAGRRPDLRCTLPAEPALRPHLAAWNWS